MVQWLDQIISQPKSGRRWDIIVCISWQDFFNKHIEENKIPTACADQCHSTHLKRKRQYYCPCQLLTNPSSLPHKENLECWLMPPVEHNHHLTKPVRICKRSQNDGCNQCCPAADKEARGEGSCWQGGIDSRTLLMAFLDQEKAFDWVLHELIWYSLCFHGVLEAYAHWVQLLYNNSTSSICCTAGIIESFSTQVGVHQGFTLLQLLFILCMDTVTETCKYPWTLLYTNNVMLVYDGIGI